MIAILLALAAAQADPATGSDPLASAEEETLYRSCTALVKADPVKAVEVANAWQLKGGSIYARQCLGLGYAAQERWQPAAVAFEQAAREAERNSDPRRADFWVQSGNAWLAAGDGIKARIAFDAALAMTVLTPELRGEIYIDRGRANVLLKSEAAARADIDQALKLVPADPFAWYLSAALALRQNDVARAKADIAKALERAPEDPDLMVMAGDVAGAGGDANAAKGYYERVIQAAPQSDAAKAAQTALSGGDEQAVAAPTTPSAAPPAEPAREAGPEGR